MSTLPPPIVVEGYDANGGQIRTTYTYTLVPEPGDMILLGTGLFGLFVLDSTRRRRA